MTQWTITLEEDPETGEIILPLPEDLLEQAGWKEGDTLEWKDNGDGSYILEKITNG
jgi:bifunctional DNA-binding transcriptional regulator/antitoxin component of YhaV-PrlF toxin-antitoxin module